MQGGSDGRTELETIQHGVNGRAEMGSGHSIRLRRGVVHGVREWSPLSGQMTGGQVTGGKMSGGQMTGGMLGRGGRGRRMVRHFHR